MKYNVVVHYEGGCLFEIEAKNKDEAKEKAEQMFADIPDSDLVANLADVFVDGCWEKKE